MAYKTNLMKTIAQSSTEGEYMEAADMGKMALYVRSIMWDLGIPQCSATVLYEDNDAAIAMANAWKLTTRTRHMDIRFKILAEWVERDLIRLERVDTSRNWAGHFMKQLDPLLFRRHADYIMGHVPPQYSARFKDVHNILSRRQDTIRGNKPSGGRQPRDAIAARLSAAWTQINTYYTAILGKEDNR